MDSSKRAATSSFLVIVFSLLLSAPVFAVESDPAIQLAQLYFVRGTSTDSWADLLATVAIQSARPELETFIGHQPSPAELHRATEAAKRAVVQVIPRAEWERAMAAVFRKYMTQNDLKETLAFYHTEAGQKLLRIQTETGREAGQAMADILHSREDVLNPLLVKSLATEFSQSSPK
jgi:hypothetical protein